MEILDLSDIKRWASYDVDFIIPREERRYDVVVILDNKKDARRETLELGAEYIRSGKWKRIHTTKLFDYPQCVEVESRYKSISIRFRFFSAAQICRLKETCFAYGTSSYFAVMDDNYITTLDSFLKYSRYNAIPNDEMLVCDFVRYVYKRREKRKQKQSSINEESWDAALDEFINSFAR